MLQERIGQITSKLKWFYGSAGDILTSILVVVAGLLLLFGFYLGLVFIVFMIFL